MGNSLFHRISHFIFPVAAPGVQPLLLSAAFPASADMGGVSCTRRSFFTAIAATAIATALPRSGDAQSPPQERAPATDAAVPSDGANHHVLSLLPEPFSYGETLLETALFGLPVRGVAKLFTAMGIPTGNEAVADIFGETEETLEGASPEELREAAGHMRSALRMQYVVTGLLLPLAEECAVRAVPAWFLNQMPTGASAMFKTTLGETRWDWGVITSLGFALMHCEEFKRVPVTQFLSGLWYWFLARRRGFDHAVLAHSATNVMLLYQLSRLLDEALAAEEEE